MTFTDQTDDNFDALAEAVAARIIDDYAGVHVYADGHLSRTHRLYVRIAKSLMAFHRREGHLELSDEE